MTKAGTNRQTPAPVPPGFVLSELGLLPDDWKVTTLGNLGRTLSGGTPRISNARFWDGEIPWVSSKDMKVARLSDSIDHVSSIALGNGTRLVRPGAILIVVRGMSLAHSFPVAIVERPLCFNQDIKAFVPHAGVHPEFILGWLQVSQLHFLSLATEATHGTKRIPTNDLLRSHIPLPSLCEQTVIADALSDVDGLLDALDSLIAKKKAVKQATMHQLLTGTTRLPGFSAKWEAKRLGQYVTFLRTGTYARAKLSPTGSLKYLHYGDIHKTTKTLFDLQFDFAPSLPSEYGKTLDRLCDGDLVFVDASEDLDGVGKSVEFSGVSNVELVAGLHTIAARFDKSLLTNGFKAYLQHFPSFRSHLRRLAAGTKVYATNRSHIESAEIILPETPEQSAIAAILADMDTEIITLQLRRAKTRAVKKGMMQALLCGRVRLIEPSCTARCVAC